MAVLELLHVLLRLFLNLSLMSLNVSWAGIFKLPASSYSHRIQLYRNLEPTPVVTIYLVNGKGAVQ